MRVTPNCDSIRSFIICQANNVQSTPDVAFGAGNYLVVWSDSRLSSTQYSIYAARVTPAGSVLDPAGIQVGPSGLFSEYEPSVVFAGNRFLAVWGHGQIPYALYGRFIDATGQLSDTLHLCLVDAAVTQTRLACDGTNYLVAWMEGRTGTVVKGLLVSGSGTPIGSPFVIATNAHMLSSIGLCFDGTDYFVTYVASGLWGRKYDRSGQPVGNPVRISTEMTYLQCYNTVIPGANNRYLNLWSDYRGGASYLDIYANIDMPILAIEESNSPARKDCRSGPSLVRDVIQLAGDEGKQAKIFDASGRQVGSTATGRFDCRTLKSGTYFVRVSGGETFKVVKIR